MTALHKACSRGNLNIVEILLKHWPEINKCDKRGNSPLSYAIKANNHEIVKVYIFFLKKLFLIFSNKGLIRKQSQTLV